MFGSKRATSTSGSQVATIIGQGTKLKGSMQATGGLRIDGEFEGDCITAGEVVVGESGIVKATIIAQIATIGGSVYGRMEIADKLELLPSAKTYGDIKVGALIIGEGAIFKGACEMRQSDE